MHLAKKNTVARIRARRDVIIAPMLVDTSGHYKLYSILPRFLSNHILPGSKHSYVTLPMGVNNLSIWNYLITDSFIIVTTWTSFQELGLAIKPETTSFSRGIPVERATF